MAVTFQDIRTQAKGQILTELLTSVQPSLITEHKEPFRFWFGTLDSVELTLPDIHIEYGRWAINQAMDVTIEGDEDCIEMQFTLSGYGAIRDLDSGRLYSFSQNQQNLYYLPGVSGQGGYQTGEFNFLEIRFSKRYFLQLAEHSSPLLRAFANGILGTTVKAIGPTNRPISLAMHQCIQDIMRCSLAGGLKRLYLQSKCIELLTLQAYSHEAIPSPLPLVCKSKYDQDCIHYAREYLLQQADNPPSLTELARIVGLNEFKLKLKKGFKEIYHHTVYGYLNDYRLEKARQLLLERAHPIKDIADKLGYSSRTALYQSI